MSRVVFDTPVAVNPQQAAGLVITSATIVFGNKSIHVHYNMVDADGVIIAQKTRLLDSPQVQTWIGNQEETIYTRLLAKEGLTGTVEPSP